MKQNELPWSEFKAFVSARLLSIQYVDMNNRYFLWAHDGPVGFSCVIFKDDGADQNDFEDNFKAAGNKSFSDADGATVLRPKAAKKGWVFGLIPFEITTAKKNSPLIAKLEDNTDRPGFTVKIYDSNNDEITDALNEGNAVKTVVEFEPTFDYEIVGGQVQQFSLPANDLRIWVVAVPDIAAPNGSKEMVGGINLKYVDPTDKVNADGRVSKYMAYNATYHTNKLKFTIRHSAGVQHTLMITLEMFRA